MAWFVPDLALVTATVTLFYCLFLFQGYQKLFRDSDAGWHIRTGEAILATGRLPSTDPYSFTRSGQPWFAWEWGADVLVGAIHRRAGLSGVALFYGAVIAAGVWLWFRLHWVLHGDFLVACAMAPLLLSTCDIHWLARPHVIGWLFLLGAMLYAETARGSFGWRNGVEIGVFTAVWANLHASFFFAPVIAGIYAVGSWWGGPPGPRPPAPGNQTWFVWAASIAAIAPLANPYGWRLYAHVFRYLTDSELLSRIGEFQSFDFHTAGAGQIIATVILGIAGGTLAFVRKRYEHFLLAILISALALRSARALPMAALVLLPIANASISATVDLPWRGYAERLRALDAHLNGLALAPLALLAAFGLLRAVPVGFPPEDFPVAAWSHIPVEARLFAPDKFGGYLIYRSNGTRKVFFDGRSDFYGAEFLKQYARMVQVRPGWREYWESFHFSLALMPNDYPLVPALEQIGWQPVYRDGTAILLARGGT
ncbi:MAG: hypothetical protein LAQ69_18015 [Acidobacteriia bacterium]|nr:hypothetical protein [Terriglobia bacterium]